MLTKLTDSLWRARLRAAAFLLGLPAYERPEQGSLSFAETVHAARSAQAMRRAWRSLSLAINDRVTPEMQAQAREDFLNRYSMVPARPGTCAFERSAEIVGHRLGVIEDGARAQWEAKVFA